MNLTVHFNQEINSRITLNNRELFFQGNKLSVDEIDPGCYMLTIDSDQEFTVESVSIDGISIEELVYLSWAEQQESKLQPRLTVMPGQSWKMPLIFPLSAMMSEVKNQVHNGKLGKDLWKEFDIFVPGSVDLNDQYPGVLRDFFRYDSRFTILPKQPLTWFNKDNLLPYETVDMPYPREELLAELMMNRPSMETEDNQFYKTRISQQFEINDTWKYWFFLRNKDQVPARELPNWQQRFMWNQARWPVLTRFLESLDFTGIVQGYIAELPPNSWIYPHSDSGSDCWGEPDRVSRLYIPLTLDDRVFFKFANFGLVDLTRPSWINNRRYTHAVVNDSDTTRYILSLGLYQK